MGAKRKLLAGDGQALPAICEQQHSRGAPWGRGKDTGRRLELTSTLGAKKSRKEETGLRHGKEFSEEEEEQVSPTSGPSSRPEQRRPLQPVKRKQRVESSRGWSPGRLSVSHPTAGVPPQGLSSPDW